MESPEAKLLHILQTEWAPQPGPQAEAYHSPADVLFYGGAAGGGKTDLLLGLAHTQHRHAIIFRREYTSLRGLEDRTRELFAGKGQYSSQNHTWRLDDGCVIEFGAVQYERDVATFQGRPHDFIGFDEVAHFSEAQFRFLQGWLRTTRPNQRTRVVAAGNPPTDAQGDWVLRYWAPWLDPLHPNPAEPGELRWFATLEGKDVELEDGTPFEHRGDLIRPLSRSYIPAKIDDNAFLIATGYKAQLQSLPEPLRTQMLEGNFGVSLDDDPWQVIPTQWVIAAQARWTEVAPGPMDALGVDVARGGQDRTILAPRHGHWFGRLQAHPGSSTPDGQTVVGLIAGAITGAPSINVDVIGVGSSVTDLARQQGLKVRACNGAAGTRARDKDGNLGFANCRAYWYWKLREALDPVSGEGLALPPDRELRHDLCSVRWRLTSRGIQAEAKDEIRARVGRSPDKGDAIVYAFAPPDWVGNAGLLELMRQQRAAGPPDGPAPEPKTYAPGSLEWAAQQRASGGR